MKIDKIVDGAWSTQVDAQVSYRPLKARIHEWAKSRGLDTSGIQEFADTAGVNRAHLFRLFKEEWSPKNVQIQYLVTIASFFGVRIDDLVDWRVVGADGQVLSSKSKVIAAQAK